ASIPSKSIKATRDSEESYERTFAKALKSLAIDAHHDARTQLDPHSRHDLRQTLERQVQTSLRMGARAAAATGPLDGKGYSYRPTVLTEVEEGMPVLKEEKFGPVAAEVRVSGADEAARVPHDSTYGPVAMLTTCVVS